MRRIALLLTALAAMMLFVAPAQAQLTFGTTEDLHTLTDVGVTGAEGEALALGYKTSKQNFLLPYTISDDGYVFIVKGQSGRYYDFDAQMAPEWQAAGLLPDPLPTYELSTLDLIIGHALWPTLVLIIIIWLVPLLRKRRTAVAATEPVPEPSKEPDRH